MLEHFEPFPGRQAPQGYLNCKTCGSVQPQVAENGKHLTASCPSCRRFITHVKSTSFTGANYLRQQREKISHG